MTIDGMHDEYFLTFWERVWSLEDGKTLPLPPMWRMKVTFIQATPQEWWHAFQIMREAVIRGDVERDAAFDYCLAALWDRMAETRYYDTGPTSPYPSPAAHAYALKTGSWG